MPDVSVPYLASPEVLISARAAAGSGAAVVSEMKIFNAKDGQGLSLADTMGIQTGFITGRQSPAVCHYVTRRLAGRGATREVIELILKRPA